MGVYVGMREIAKGYNYGHIQAEAPFGILRKVTYDQVTYQTLALQVGREPRKFEVEKKRFDEKGLLLNYQQTRRYCYFTFEGDTFGDVVPRGMKRDSDEFKKMQKDAGVAFDDWDKDYMK